MEPKSVMWNTPELIFSSHISIQKCMMWRLILQPEILNENNKQNLFPIECISSVQSLFCVRLFATPGTAACQASLSITNSQSLLKLTFIESVMPSNHLILCHPLLLPPSIFPSIRFFQMSQLFASGGQSIGVSASASVLPWIFRTDFL